MSDDEDIRVYFICPHCRLLTWQRNTETPDCPICSSGSGSLQIRIEMCPAEITPDRKFIVFHSRSEYKVPVDSVMLESWDDLLLDKIPVKG